MPIQSDAAQAKEARKMPDYPTTDELKDAAAVVVSITDTLREYLETDSSFSAEIAVERVRALVNSQVAMSAFVADAVQPGEKPAPAVIAEFAGALDNAGPQAEVTVLRLIDVMEGPLAQAV